MNPADAAQPWLAPYAPRAARVLESAGQGAGVAETLSAESVAIDLPAGPLRFVPGDSAPVGEAYEAFIFRTACVPTRDNLHDLFNGLVWLHFPQAKRRLNELQATEIARAGVGATRGPLRDALTLFDENGAVLEAPPALWEALIARDWQRLFVARRGLWREARLLVFGHALLEKLASPRKAATAHVLMGPGDIPSIKADDASIISALDSAHLATKPFVPLPVLGVPGWWKQNENFSFYDDSEVFRPRRVPEPSPTQTALQGGA
ncbi:DUF3025 domain-containing protein [Variovorax sp. J22P240]|uniref:DUF3025 domain-containing protein n=1 Tax=unclassified Variovorax TaxID=663243 RepID=UPI002576857E|nr:MULTISPECIES: DUF3025 domain-containing protein [unclassified Variovorax]MDL9999555.1 DUF3025 domain-containing protein [Variovorax sp. J22P240]MDM0048984.1 DUF3025 domain-containing protein [Variovorax sp. J22R115]